MSVSGSPVVSSPRARVPRTTTRSSTSRDTQEPRVVASSMRRTTTGCRVSGAGMPASPSTTSGSCQPAGRAGVRSTATPIGYSAPTRTTDTARTVATHCPGRPQGRSGRTTSPSTTGTTDTPNRMKSAIGTWPKCWCSRSFFHWPRSVKWSRISPENTACRASTPQARGPIL